MIPPRALEQHLAIIGKTGSGKTTAAKGEIERILDAGGRACIVDPTGVWWGLRTAADGKGTGYPVAIFGGAHGDFPAGPEHGHAIAEIVGTSSTPVIVDTSLMRVGERTRFFTEFAEQLMRANRGPLHLVIDECHLFMPQGKVADPRSGAMLHAANNLVSLGRSRGLRIMLISQRPAKVHKDSLTQVETLVAMRLVAPQDRAAVVDWIKDNADQQQGREIIASLATLKTGHGWIWAPEIGVLERVQFPRIRTFDSSRAPGHDDAGVALAAIDRSAIAARLEQVAAEVAANDPAALRERIADLEAQLQRSEDPQIEEAALQAAYQRGVGDGEASARQAFTEALRMQNRGLRERLEVLIDQLGGLQTFFTDEAPAPAPRPAAPAPLPAAAPPPRAAVAPAAAAARRTPGAASTPLSKAERLVLTALAQYPRGRTKAQVAILTGYAVNGGGFNNAISACRSRGYLEGSGDALTITDAGRKALGPFQALPRGKALLQHWLGQLGKAERAALQSLADVYPKALDKAALAARAGYEANGGGFNNALSRLRTLELISGRGELRASEDLFG